MLGSRSIADRASRTYEHSRSAIDALIAAAETGQHLVADGAGVRRDLVDADAVADQRRPGRRAWTAPAGTSVTSTAIRSIETRPTSGQRLPATSASAPGCAVAGARGAQEAVGIADRRRSRCGVGRLRGPGRAVADGRALRDVAHLHDARLAASTTGAHRVGLARRRIAAVERDAGAHQVVMRRARRGRCRTNWRARPAMPRNSARDLAEALDLLVVERMVRLLGAGEVAHQQRDAVILRRHARARARPLRRW